MRLLRVLFSLTAYAVWLFIHPIQAAPQNFYPSPPQNSYPPQPQNYYPSAPQNSYPPQPQNYYPSSPQNSYSPPPQNYYPSAPQNNHREPQESDGYAIHSIQPSLCSAHHAPDGKSCVFHKYDYPA